MSLPEEYRAIAREISNYFDHQEISRVKFGSRYPQWWGRLLTSLLIGVASKDIDDIRYASAAYSDAGFQIVIVTPTRILVGAVKDVDEDNAEHSVRVGSRARIRSVEFSFAGSPFDDRAFRDWPGSPAVVVRSDELGVLSLPLEGSAGFNDSDEKLQAVLEDLVEGIGADH